MSVRVTFVLFFLYIPAFYSSGNPDEYLQKVVIRSIKTGAFIVAGNVSDVLLAQNEDMLTGNQFWALEADDGFYVIRNLKNSAIMDVKGGCRKVMQNIEVITYERYVPAENNRFYISAVDNTIGVQCPEGSNLKMRVDKTGKLVMTNIINPATSKQDIHFCIECISS